jgi:hypothetical protein
MILLLLAAIPVGLAILLTAGGGAPRRALAGPPVSFELLGGSSGSAGACGGAHHYAVYQAGSAIRFQGNVGGSGSSAVKVRLKACVAGAFRPSGDAAGHVGAGGGYVGSFSAPIAGYYFARAEVRQSDGTVGRSGKRYFQVR